jgi:hypothetical protein
MSKDSLGEQASVPNPSNAEQGVIALDETPKGRWERLWPVIACGAGLFSDGYLNGVGSLPIYVASTLVH